MRVASTPRDHRQARNGGVYCVYYCLAKLIMCQRAPIPLPFFTLSDEGRSVVARSYSLYLYKYKYKYTYWWGDTLQ